MNRVIHMPAAIKTVAGPAVAATAITAAGFLTVSPPARAHPMLPLAPACNQWGLNGVFSLQQSNGDTVRFTMNGPVASGTAHATGGLNGPLQGPVSGGIQGDKLDFKVTWGANSVGDYTGSVGSDGFAHGDTSDEWQPIGDGPGSYAHWDSTVPLVCSTPATPTPAPISHQPVPPALQAPPPAPAPISHQPVPPELQQPMTTGPPTP
jgi:hypothetical protein